MGLVDAQVLVGLVDMVGRPGRSRPVTMTATGILQCQRLHNTHKTSTEGARFMGFLQVRARGHAGDDQWGWVMCGGGGGRHHTVSARAQNPYNEHTRCSLHGFRARAGTCRVLKSGPATPKDQQLDRDRTAAQLDRGCGCLVSRRVRLRVALLRGIPRTGCNLCNRRLLVFFICTVLFCLNIVLFPIYYTFCTTYDIS
jgi:hypothetical protein